MKNKVYLYYFTGTGNTKLMAETVKAGLSSGGCSVSMTEINDNTVPEGNYDDAAIGVLFPVYGLSMARVMKRFISRLPRTAGGEFFVVANAHSNTGSSLKQAAGLMKKKGYILKGAVGTYTPSSSVITEDTEPADRAAEMRNTAAAKVQAFCSRLLGNDAEVETESISGKERMVSILFFAAMPNAVIKKAKVNGNCTGCGTCVKICPMGNISLADGKPVWGPSCEVCMRCINLCTTGAIEMMSSAGRKQYREPSFEP